MLLALIGQPFPCMTRLLASCLFAALLGNASATTLTFEGLGLGDNSAIPQSYGDNSGTTPNVTVSYRELDGFGGSSSVVYDHLHYWTSGYGNLSQVAWGSTDHNNVSHVAEISLVASAGWEVMLNSFDLAGWLTNQPGRAIRIYDGDYNELTSYTNQTILSSGNHSSFSPGVAANVVHLQWDYPWGVAIDNVSFQQRSTGASVPDAGSTWALLGAAMAGLAAVRNRRSA